jgi:hypothetical protein
MSTNDISIITQALTSKKSVTTDGLNVQNHSLAEVVAAHKYLCGLEAGLNNKKPFRVMQSVLPGTAQNRCV